MALPVNGSTHLIPADYSFCRPRKDERLSWPSWLTCSGWFTHISGHPSAAGRAQDRESSPARDRRSTTVLRHQRVTLVEINGHKDISMLSQCVGGGFGFVTVLEMCLSGRLGIPRTGHSNVADIYH